MSTISIPAMDATDTDGNSVTVYGIDLAGTVPAFVVMRQNENGDFVLATLPVIRGVEIEAEAPASA